MNLLKTPDRKRFSRKNVTWICCLLLVVVSVARGAFNGTYPPQYIFTGLLTLIGFLLGLAEAGKKFANHTPPPDESKP